MQLWRGPGTLSPEQYQKNIQKLEDERQKLEEKLGERSAEFRSEQQPLTLEQVQRAIPPGAALLEIFRYTPYDPKSDRFGEPHYVAYVLHPGGDPSFADLGLAAPIEAAVQKLRAALGDHNLTHDPRPAARAAYDLVMQPIRKLLGPARWVLSSPDAALNLIPFEALVDEQGHYLIENFAFTYLTSGRDLIRFSAHAAPRQGALVVADPDFGIRDPAAPYFSPLPTTAEEARAITSRLSGAQMLLGTRATEGAIKGVAAPKILHLATHGFFREQEPEPEARPTRSPPPSSSPPR